MRKQTISLASIVFAAGVAAAVLVAPANAQFSYILDDGTSENSVGLMNGGTLGWLNGFDTTANNVITSVQVSFGTPVVPGFSGVAPGDSFNVFVFADTDLDPTNGATLLSTAVGSVDAGSIDTNGFTDVPINAVVNTPFFWIAAEIDHGAGEFPASRDTATPSGGRSWLTDGDVQGNLGGASEVDAIGLSGTFLLRAEAIPAPGAAGVLGLAGLAAARRRR